MVPPAVSTRFSIPTLKFFTVKMPSFTSNFRAKRSRAFPKANAFCVVSSPSPFKLSKSPLSRRPPFSVPFVSSFSWGILKTVKSVESLPSFTVKALSRCVLLRKATSPLKSYSLSILSLSTFIIELL